jgi:hypothetical protein
MYSSSLVALADDEGLLIVEDAITASSSGFEPASRTVSV